MTSWVPSNKFLLPTKTNRIIIVLLQTMILQNLYLLVGIKGTTFIEMVIACLCIFMVDLPVFLISSFRSWNLIILSTILLRCTVWNYGQLKPTILFKHLPVRMGRDRYLSIEKSLRFIGISILIYDSDLLIPSSYLIYLYIGHSNIIWDVDFSSEDRNIFASASQDHTVRLWDQRKVTFIR